MKDLSYLRQHFKGLGMVTITVWAHEAQGALRD